MPIASWVNPIKGSIYQVLKHLAAHPQATQRDLAKALGLSLGSANFCIRAVIDRGWLKAITE
jgi:DNA-binding MarR family transcriptional regulator